jgi:hypothetical protein
MLLIVAAVTTLKASQEAVEVRIKEVAAIDPRRRVSFQQPQNRDQHSVRL